MHDVAVLRDRLEQLLPEALEILRRMVEINSFTENRQGVDRLGRLTAETFAPLGFSAEQIAAENPAFGNHLVLTRAGTSDRAIALIGHLDTVFPPEEEERNGFRWQREGDRIYGPGTEDIKGGTAMMWMVLSALKTHLPEVFEAITWKLLWNAAEERFSPDFGQVCRDHFNGDTVAALVFEAQGRRGAEGLLVRARKGRATWRVTVSGRGAHAGGKHRHGANAAVQLGHTIRQIAALTDYDKEITFNVGTVSGGTVLNRVPHAAWAEGEFRAFTADIYAQAKAALLGLAGPGEVRSGTDQYPCQVQVNILTESRPWPPNPATDRLLELWLETARELGIPAGSQERGGLSDGNQIWDVVPTLDGLGPSGDNDHCSERSADGSKLPEYVEVSSFVPKALLNVAALARLETATRR